MGSTKVSDGKHMWVQLRKDLITADWIYKNNQAGDEKTFETDFQYQTKLTKQNSTSTNPSGSSAGSGSGTSPTIGTTTGIGTGTRISPVSSPGSSSSGCFFFHRDVDFKFSITSMKHSDTIKIGVYVTTRNQSDQSHFLRSHVDHRCNELCRSYTWGFDACLIKMEFRNGSSDLAVVSTSPGSGSVAANDATEGNFVKRFHLNVNFPNGHHTECESFSKKLLSSRSGDSPTTPIEFVPVSIQVFARMYLFCWNRNDVRVPPDVNCILGKSTGNLEVLEFLPYPASPLDLLSIRPKKKLRYDSPGFDVIIFFGGADGSESPRKSIPAHSSVLTAFGPKLCSMLKLAPRDKSTNRAMLNMDKEISIEFFEPMQWFLNFLYLYHQQSSFTFGGSWMNRSSTNGNAAGNAGNNCGTWEQWNPFMNFQVLRLAIRFQVPELVDFCLDSLLCRSNLEFSLKFVLKLLKNKVLCGGNEMNDLRQRCMQCIARNKTFLKAVEGKALLMDFLKSVDNEVVYNLIISL